MVKFVGRLTVLLLVMVFVTARAADAAPMCAIDMGSNSFRRIVGSFDNGRYEQRPIEKRTLGGKDVNAVGGGVLIVCLAERIERDEVEALAQGIVEWHKALAPAGDTTCVFRDSAFADDIAKTNLAAILEQHGIANVRSL